METARNGVLAEGDGAMTEGYRGWLVRGMDVSAVVAWLTLLVLAVAQSMSRADELTPWCAGCAAASVTLTCVAWASRRFDRLEREAFDRGLRAGMGVSGVSKIDEHRY